MERRRYRRKKSIRAAMMDQEDASKEQHQTGGKSAVKFTPGQERTPTMTSSDYRYSQHPSVWIFV